MSQVAHFVSGTMCFLCLRPLTFVQLGHSRKSPGIGAKSLAPAGWPSENVPAYLGTVSSRNRSARRVRGSSKGNPHDSQDLLPLARAYHRFVAVSRACLRSKLRQVRIERWWAQLLRQLQLRRCALRSPDQRFALRAGQKLGSRSPRSVGRSRLPRLFCYPRWAPRRAGWPRWSRFWSGRTRRWLVESGAGRSLASSWQLAWWPLGPRRCLLLYEPQFRRKVLLSSSRRRPSVPCKLRKRHLVDPGFRRHSRRYFQQQQF